MKNVFLPFYCNIFLSQNCAQKYCVRIWPKGKINIFFRFSPFFPSILILTWPVRSYPWPLKKEWDFKTITDLANLPFTTTTTARISPQQHAHWNNNYNNNEDHCLNQVMKENATVKNNNNNGWPLLSPHNFCT